MKNVIPILTIAIFLPQLQACGNFPAYLKPIEPAKVDTGIIDYRHVNEDGDFSYHFFPTECFDSEKSTKCKQQTIKSNRIHANESVGINLLYGYICDFPEDARSWEELKRDYGDDEEVPICWGKEARAGVKGEVSILATVFELDGKRKISFTQGEASDPEGRVVYYSEDVRETGQPLNLSNLPMYGPVTYHGKPVFLRFAGVELDQKESKETGALLRSLASLGSKAYPPASPVLAALDKVGGSFLEGQQDDLFFKYEMMFNGDGGTAPVVAPLSAGIMSFVRVQNRSKKFDWINHCIDKHTGIIHTSGSPFCKGECVLPPDNKKSACKPGSTELKGHTYFTIQITKNEPALSNDAFQTFTELNELTNEDVVLPNAISEYADELGVELEKTARFDRARSLIKTINAKSLVEQEKANNAVFDALCLGYDNKTSAFVEKSRLSPDKRYNLLKWLEQEWNQSAQTTDQVTFNPALYSNDSSAKALCADSTHTDWGKLIRQL